MYDYLMLMCVYQSFLIFWSKDGNFSAHILLLLRGKMVGRFLCLCLCVKLLDMNLPELNTDLDLDI